ncbi:MAG: ATP-binding protein [Gammaproteobacteria bacterium]|nr:ATP-binding protein [Gammaproteobacteria bacterium]
MVSPDGHHDRPPRTVQVGAQRVERSRAVALIGPRQVGKTTLARRFLPADAPNYFDLEDPRDLERLSQPMSALAPLHGLIVIDEVQRRPELFPVLRVLIDREGTPARFLILGSASPALLRQSSESLAGRMEVLEMAGLSCAEVGVRHMNRLWQRGGFPLSFVARTDEDSASWRESFIRLTVERDLPGLGLGAPGAAIRRFWAMVAHYHGQIWNAAEPARSLGVSESTVRRYLDFLTDAYLVRQLRPWFENLAKRQVKSPKVYVRDSGLLHALFGLRGEADLLTHPKAGASWEGFMLEQVLQLARPDEAYFWATHQGAELDLLMFKHGRRVGAEFKRADAPTLTPSMRIAMEDLRLDRLIVIYPGNKAYPLAANVEVLPAVEVARLVP